jgi:hypothetical protein
MRTSRTLTFAAASGLSVASCAALALAVASPAAAATSQVSILHGVPGLTVDVYANGNLLLEDFAPGTLTDPQALEEGSYDLAVFPANADSAGTPAIQANDVSVPGGANITVVAHLDAGGDPVLTPFVNDVSSTGAGQGRLTVRHTAAAPAVDVRAGGTPVFTNLTNPNEAKADLDAASVSADVVLAGTDTVAIGPADVNIAEGVNTIVYAWGSAEDENLALAVQTVSGLHSGPSGVPAGSAGLLDDDGLPLSLAAVALLAAGGAVLAGRRLVAERASARR